MATSSAGELHFIESIMDWFCIKIFQLDCDSKHSAKIVKEHT